MDTRDSAPRAKTASMSLIPVAMEIVPPEEPASPRRGRPAGSHGSQIARVKRRLALGVVSGKRNREIANDLGVSTKTVCLWLRHPDVQMEIQELERELHRRTERHLTALFRTSVRRLGEILKHGDDKAALRATELVWRAHGRLLAGMEEAAIGAHAVHRPRMFIHDREDAEAAVALLKAERRRIAREREANVAAQLGQRAE